MIFDDKWTLNTSRDRIAYYDFSDKVGLLVDDYIKKYISSDPVQAKAQFYAPMLSKKLGTQKLRANMVCASYLFFTGAKKINIPEKLIKYCAIVEFVSWGSYMINWIYDSKSKVEDLDTRKRVVVAANSFLQDAIKLASTETPELMKIILDANDQLIKSFGAQLDVLKITNDQLLENYQKYFKFYKDYYGGPGVGTLFSASIHLGYLLSNSNELITLNKMKKIFYVFGIHYETLNALSDFIITDDEITHEKMSSDQFSDIKTNTLTPPLWFMVNHSTSVKKLILKGINKGPDIKYQQQVVQALFNSGAFSEISTSLKKTGRRLKNKFPKPADNNIGVILLKQMISVFESNKIYHLLQQNYDSKSDSLLQ